MGAGTQESCRERLSRPLQISVAESEDLVLIHYGIEYQTAKDAIKVDTLKERSMSLNEEREEQLKIATGVVSTLSRGNVSIPLRLKKAQNIGVWERKTKILFMFYVTAVHFLLEDTLENYELQLSFGIICMEKQEEPQDIVEAAGAAVLNLLPTKSRNLYDKTYNQFREWCKRKKVQSYTENVMLAYLHEKSNEYKSSTVWAQYSMLKSYDCV
ncbi:hypothetical protein NQ317_014865 [Molorchus minor]|uniref:Uncharacterized protein n=1 Tax=Molorchus minor TaxID=1323400 RepID=A0ABQ9JSL7_9CUCU|nr:hypothetical protein NQ317_014865 [Molorchus minor]